MENTDISLDSDTYAKVILLARAWKITPSQTIARLIDNFGNPAPAAIPDTPAGPGDAADGVAPEDRTVAVHAFYQGRLISGRYDPANRSLTVAPGPGAGTYKSPSGAATAVLQALNPAVHPNRNGWSFWFLDDTGATLQSIRGEL